jgi:hypothetical protein
MRLANPPETPFYADSNELLFVSIALKLTEISVDCDPTLNRHSPNVAGFMPQMWSG